ncbi:hypothetical protein BH23BAC4_BH23BAC4_12100 [soil metagenome]
MPPSGKTGTQLRPAKPGSMGHAMQEAAPFVGLGLQIAAAMGFFAGTGFIADRFLGTSPWGILAGCAMGIVAVFAVLYKLLVQLDQKDSSRRSRDATNSLDLPDAPKRPFP